MSLSWRSLTVLLLLVACAGMCVSAGAADLKPVYARLALPPDGSQTILLKLRCDQSKIARDLLFADLNLDGTLQPTEKFVGKVQEVTQSGCTYCQFPEFTVQVAGQQASHALTVESFRMFVPDKAFQDFYVCMLRTELAHDWMFSGTCQLTVGSSDRVAAAGAIGPTALKIETRADTAKPGYTGFGVTLGWPTLVISTFMLPSGPAPVALKVTDRDGKVVHQESVAIDKLGFG